MTEALTGEPLDRMCAMIEQVIDKVSVVYPKLHQIVLDKCLRVGKTIETLRAMNVPDEMIDAIIFGMDTDRNEKALISEAVKLLAQYLPSFFGGPTHQAHEPIELPWLELDFTGIDLTGAEVKTTHHIQIDPNDTVRDLASTCHELIRKNCRLDSSNERRCLVDLFDQDGKVIDSPNDNVNDLMLSCCVPTTVEWRFL